jgi:hypothetical protein
VDAKAVSRLERMGLLINSRINKNQQPSFIWYFPDYVCQRTDQLDYKREDGSRGAEVASSRPFRAVSNLIQPWRKKA